MPKKEQMFSFERECPVCHKTFIMTSYDLWAYKKNNLRFCSWGCLQAHLRYLEEKKLKGVKKLTMTGREFENLIVKELHKAGYWVHRIHSDESGQQPFDIIAIKGNMIYAYDAKVISEGHRFPLKRIESNQLNAFRLFEKKTSAQHIGLLIYVDEHIRYMSLSAIETALAMGKKSIDAMTDLAEWRIV